MLKERGLTVDTIERLRLGITAPNRDGLTSHLLKEGFSANHITLSGLTIERDNGQVFDRFRHRLMIPICRESDSIVAFGGVQ